MSKQIASTVDGMTQAQQDKLDEDLMECRTAHVLQVDAAYRASQGNAELYIDSDVSLVDCLRRRSLVPRDYTVSRFQAESESRIAMAGTGGTPEEFQAKLESAFSFDLDDPAVQTCVVSNDPVLFAHRLETWRPLG
ncbi:hypothetical protein [Bifidobacterium cuniculi]|nr:hypothetical protein [Bifidobacterium cuniculi]